MASVAIARENRANGFFEEVAAGRIGEGGERKQEKNAGFSGAGRHLVILSKTENGKRAALVFVVTFLLALHLCEKRSTERSGTCLYLKRGF